MNTESQDPTEQKVDRCYSTYNSGGQLEFDPLKDLNLPANYEEVVSRFQRLQRERALEVMN